MIMQAVGVAEDNIFKKRKEDEVIFTTFSPQIYSFRPEMKTRKCLSISALYESILSFTMSSSFFRKTLREETKRKEKE